MKSQTFKYSFRYIITKCSESQNSWQCKKSWHIIIIIIATIVNLHLIVGDFHTMKTLKKALILP